MNRVFDQKKKEKTGLVLYSVTLTRKECEKTLCCVNITRGSGRWGRTPQDAGLGVH